MLSEKKRGDGHRWATGEERWEMIEAMAHDPGKASRARVGDHATASAELLMRTGFGDEDEARHRCVYLSVNVEQEAWKYGEICPFRGSNPGGAIGGRRGAPVKTGGDAERWRKKRE